MRQIILSNPDKDTARIIQPKDGEEIEIRECYSGVGFPTEKGYYSIALRDGGIEVSLDGKLILTPHTKPTS